MSIAMYLILGLGALWVVFFLFCLAFFLGSYRR